MAISAAALQECLGAVGAFLENRRPPEEFRAKLDYQAHIDRSTVLIISRRPKWNDPAQIIDSPVVKIRWINARKVWRIFWMRADLRWHAYKPLPEMETLEAALSEVDRDPFGCFFG